MTGMPAQPAPPAAPSAQPGYFQRAEQAVQRILPHAGAVALEDATRIETAVKDHAGTVFDVAGDVLAILKLIDPADAPAITAAQVLIPKVLAMAESAARIGQALHHAS